MTILLVGGGSGGHITPVIAVAEALKKKQPEARLVYVIGTGDKLSDIPQKSEAIDSVVSIRAGKFRRYHGEGWRQLLDIPTVLKNIRDAVYVVIGLFQSYRLLGKERPAIIFIKGGFVGVPLGLAAALRRIPYITHDSDAVPGLANRIIARWARQHTVAMPPEAYPYPADKTTQVGVPVGKNYQKVTKLQRQQWRGELNIPADARVLCVTGGGNGSVLVNKAITDCAERLFSSVSRLFIVHIAGRGKQAAVRMAYDQIAPAKDKAIVEDFVTDFYKYSGVADVIVTRAGANTLADFAAQERACIVIPNPYLTGGHQLKNAAVLEQQHAIEVVNESELSNHSDLLANKIIKLFNDSAQRQLLGGRLHASSRSDAAATLAELILKATV